MSASTHTTTARQPSHHDLAWRILLATLMVLTFSAASMTTKAQAADGKTYPATVCERWNAPENAPRSAMAVSQFGRIINQSNNQRLGIVCPIVRDSMRGKIERIKAWGIHRNCAGRGEGQTCPGNSRCTFRIMQMSGDQARSSSPAANEPMVRVDESQQAAAIIAVGWVNLSVPDFTSANGTGPSGSTFVLFCRLAPGAELSSIYIGEET